MQFREWLPIDDPINVADFSLECRFSPPSPSPVSGGGDSKGRGIAHGLQIHGLVHDGHRLPVLAGLEPVFFDKNAALHMLMRYQGGYDKDNKQHRPDVIDKLLNALTPVEQIQLRGMLKAAQEVGNGGTAGDRKPRMQVTH